MRTHSMRILLALCMTIGPAVIHIAAAQSRTVRVELTTGHAGYVDDVWDNRVLAGGAARIALSPWVTVGPEVVYQHGFEWASEVVATGAATIDLRDSWSTRRTIPYLVAAAGISWRRERLGRGPYVYREFTASAGMGVRRSLPAGWYVAGDVRLGWEPERRVSLIVGWQTR